MTREEYTIKQERSIALSESMLNAISYISSLEKRISELEAPSTCEDCRFTTDGRYNCSHWSSNEEDPCARYIDLVDYYEPKDKE